MSLINNVDSLRNYSRPTLSGAPGFLTIKISSKHPKINTIRNIGLSLIDNGEPVETMPRINFKARKISGILFDIVDRKHISSTNLDLLSKCCNNSLKLRLHEIILKGG